MVENISKNAIIAFTTFMNSLIDSRDTGAVEIDEKRWEEVFTKEGQWQSFEVVYKEEITSNADGYIGSNTITFAYVLTIVINPRDLEYKWKERYFHIGPDDLDEDPLDLFYNDYDSGYTQERTYGYTNVVSDTDFTKFITKLQPYVEKHKEAYDNYIKLVSLLKNE